MITPESLEPENTVAIVSTARKISKEEIFSAIKLFEKWGLHVRLGKYLFSEYHQFAGKDIERAEDFQNMLDDPNVKAIFCARGGYGTIRIMDLLDFSTFRKNPKWIVGYSDVTVLHSYVNRLDIETLHATMPLDFLENGSFCPSIETLKKALFGETLSYRFESHSLNQFGETEGILTGGNLSILYSLRGTSLDIDTNEKILFLEDIDEYLYHIDRMMMNLKLGGKLSGLKGLLVGGMTNMNDNTIPYGKNAEEIISDIVQEYNYPVCFGVPAGHIKCQNQALILGKKVKMTITATDSHLEF